MAHYSLSIVYRASLIIETAFPDISTGQPGPSLCPAPINNSATCFRRHSFAKSMIPGPFDPAGLKSAFHLISPLFYYIFKIFCLKANCCVIHSGMQNPKPVI